VPALWVLDRVGLRPSSLTVQRPSLDDVFLTKTGWSLREGSGALLAGQCALEPERWPSMAGRRWPERVGLEVVVPDLHAT